MFAAFFHIFLSTAAITDAMMFFQTPTNMPTITASAPSDSVRLCAILPEFYGTASGFFERIESRENPSQVGYPTNIYDFKTNTIQDLMPQYTPGSGLPVLGPVLATNRIYSTRTYLWPWLNLIYPTSLTYGAISDSRGEPLTRCIASSKLPGSAFPDIDWTDDFATDFMDKIGESWIEVWLSLDDLPTDGVWRRQKDGNAGEGAAIAEAIRFAYGAYWQGIDVPWSAEQHCVIPLDNRSEIVSNTCFQLLVDTIGDEATARALTNTTQRINRPQLTAIEHAIALQDVSFENFPTPRVETHCKDYAVDYSATWSGSAGWSIDFVAGKMKFFGLGNATGSGTNSVSDVDTITVEPCASCSGVARRAACAINGGENSIFADYVAVSNAVCFGATSAVVTQEVTDVRFSQPNILIFELGNNQSFQADINRSGTNNFIMTGTSRMSSRVFFPGTAYTFDGPNPERDVYPDLFWWENGFVDFADVAEVIRCIRKSGTYLDDPQAVFMHTPGQEIMDGPGTPLCEAAAAVDGGLRSRVAILNFSTAAAVTGANRCLDRVNAVAGGDIRNIDNLMTVADASSLATAEINSLKASVANPGINIEPPTIGDLGIDKIAIDNSTGDGIVIFNDETRTFQFGDPVYVGGTPLDARSDTSTNSTPSAAFAEFLPMSRVKWHFRNLRLED